MYTYIYIYICIYMYIYTYVYIYIFIIYTDSNQLKRKYFSWNAWMDRNHIKTKNVNMGWVSAQKIALQATRIVFT